MSFLGLPEGLIRNIKPLLNKLMILLTINEQIGCREWTRRSNQRLPFCISITPLLLRLAYNPDIKRMEYNYKNVDGQEEKVIGEPVGFADDIHVFLDQILPTCIYSWTAYKNFQTFPTSSSITRKQNCSN